MMLRRLALASLFMVLLGLPSAASPATVEAASCVRFSTGVFDSPGPDTGSRTSLNAEWVRIKNYCSTSKSIGGWKIHDYGKKFTYAFGSTVKIAAGASITLHTGKGTSTASHKYWGKTSYVWNNTCPEKAYLRSGAGTLLSSWTSCR